MKKVLLFVATIALLSSFTRSGGIDDVIAAIKSGNAALVSTYFDKTIEITLLGESGSYSRGQGETVLKDFFSKNIIKSFTLIHQGEAGGSQYCMGKLETSKGTFRTTLNLKQKGDKQFLQKIKFEN